MSFLVETGAGTPSATAYTTPAFVTAYLTDHAREVENLWSTQNAARQQEAVMVATAYVDSRWGARFKGARLRSLIGGRAAKGTVTFTANPLDTETVVLGQITYRFVATLAQENDVLIGAALADSLASLLSAVLGVTTGLDVHVDTLPNYEVATTLSGSVVTVGAAAEGVNSNEIVLTTTVTGATASGSGTLAGGLDEGPQPLCFPRGGLFDRDGRLVQGVPLKLRQAVAEYAVRSLSSALQPDPTADAYGSRVQRTKSRVGSLLREVEYVEGAALQINRPYPAADQLLSEYVTSVGVVR